MRSFIFTAIATGCTGISQGTSVGNPTELTVQAAVSSDVLLEEGTAYVSEIHISYVDQTWEELEVVDTLDLVEGGTLEIPSGIWKHMTILFDAPIELFGSTDSGGSASLFLDVPAVRLAAKNEEVVFGEEGFLLELAFPGWLDDDYAQYDSSGEVQVESGSLVHDRLSIAVTEYTTLFGDSNGDRRVNDDEREGGGHAGCRDRD